MLIINSAQMQHIAERQERDGVLRFLRDSYPSADDLTPTRVEGALQHAARRGFLDQATRRRYVHLSFLLGWNLEDADSLDWARDLLDQPGRTPVERLRALLAETLKLLPDENAAL